MRANRLATAGATAALMVGPALALAGDDIFDDTVSSCTGTNCSSLRLPGQFAGLGTFTSNWSINALARTGECARFDLISPPGTLDLEVIVVAPGGAVYRNDDRSPTDRRPLVKISPVPLDGWYRVIVTHFAGTNIGIANAVLLYGRYAAGNPNCNNPTFPLAASVPGLVDADELAEAAKREDR